MGALLCFLLSLPVARSQFKLDLILKELSTVEGHPIGRINELAEEQACSQWLFICQTRSSRRMLIGYYIPLLLWASLAAASVFAWAGVLTTVP